MKLTGWKRFTELFPDLPQVACFDTAFHRSMPEVAQRYALPGPLYHEGLRRYGFHGLSYEYILQELAQEAGAPAAQGKLIVAHLGNGASMAAIKGGRSLDTTMGLTPAGGLVMSTRSGDLDPGVILYLLQEKGMTPAAVNHLINQEAGLLGISGLSSDMQDLLAQTDTNPMRPWLWIFSVIRPGNLPVPLQLRWVDLTPSSLPGASGRTLLPSGDASVRPWDSWACAWTRA